nr:transcriptional regulator [Rhizobium sp. Q54]
MADQNNTIASADTIANVDALPKVDAPAAVEAEPAPKKQRKPRMKKVSPENAGAETAAQPDGVNNQKKRGRKPKALRDASAAKREPVERPRKNDEATAVEGTSVGEEMADLLQLEEENQRLRKLLTEKLRAENADLRKKLKLD